MKKIIINNVEYCVFAANEGTAKPQPHIIEALSETVPEGKQRSLLKEYLKQNGIVPIKGANTHWLINTVLKLDLNKEKVGIEKPHEQQYLPLTEENIEEQHKAVRTSSNYGKEARIIEDVLKKFPDNDDLNTIVMKIAVIDVTNSTHLSLHKSKLSLYDLAKVILDIPNFDERVAKGDPELVNIIAKNTGAVNLFSFASKYCTYHNVVIYERDDYSIYDSIVKENLPYYIQGLTAYRIDKWRRNFDYESFNECVGKLLDRHNIHIPLRRRKFDYFLWYPNR